MNDSQKSTRHGKPSQVRAASRRRRFALGHHINSAMRQRLGYPLTRVRIV